MNIEIIAVGSELLQGRDNSDLVYLSKKLQELGYGVRRAVTVADDERRIAEEFTRAIVEAPVTIATGGLGPTFDDLTRQALARAIKAPLTFDPSLFAKIEQRFTLRGASCPAENRNQAYVFASSQVLSNDYGTAPGLWVRVPRKNRVVILLPGPPNELIPMFERHVVPLLIKKFPPPATIFRNFYICGFSESEVNHRILPLVKRLGAQSVPIECTILASTAIIELRLIARGGDRSRMALQMARVTREVRLLVGDGIYSEAVYDLAAVVRDLLVANAHTIAVAESCTGGLLAGRLTELPGSSRFFKGGVVAYSDALKRSMLGVNARTLTRHGAVSRQTCHEMLKGILHATGADCAIAVTGIAGPAGGTAAKPVGLVYIGVHTPRQSVVEEHQFSGTRWRIRQITIHKALNTLRLLEQSCGPSRARRRA